MIDAREWATVHKKNPKQAEAILDAIVYYRTAGRHRRNKATTDEIKSAIERWPAMHPVTLLGCILDGTA